MKRNEWLSALKDSLASRKAVSFIKNRNLHEVELKKKLEKITATAARTRPLVVWSGAENVRHMTKEQKEKIAMLCGFEGNTGYGWNILALAWSFEEQMYAVVCEASNGLHAIVYPNGEHDTHKGFSFRMVGDWGVTLHHKPVPKVAAPVERAIDHFQSSALRISGLYFRDHMRI